MVYVALKPEIYRRNEDTDLMTGRVEKTVFTFCLVDHDVLTDHIEIDSSYKRLSHEVCIDMRAALDCKSPQ